MEDDRFEWDDEKAATNARKHGVTFEEASSAVDDPRALVRYDTTHSNVEDRWFLVGLSERNRLLVVTYTERNGRVRLITACKARQIHRKAYEDQNP